MARSGHVKKMARRGDAERLGRSHDGRMHTRYADGVAIRVLQDGDTAPLAAIFERLGPRSRQRRFGGAKTRLSERELATLARVDGDHHVLVAYVDGDPQPAGVAQLVRDGRTAEIAIAVADVHQRRGVGSLLARELAADARAAGITTFHATVSGDNPPAVSLLTRLAKALRATWRGSQREFVVEL
jgi:ribosomal protein S18 acetylase RimI-like enzyme